MKKAKVAEFRIKRPSKIYGLYPEFVQRIQIIAVQSVVFYGAKL